MSVDSNPGILLLLGSLSIGAAAWLPPVLAFHRIKKSKGEQLLKSVPPPSEVAFDYLVRLARSANNSDDDSFARANCGHGVLLSVG
jgi:hypothetical protein